MSEHEATPPSKEFLDSIDPDDLQELQQVAKEADRDDQQMCEAIAWQLEFLHDNTADWQQRQLFELRAIHITKKVIRSSAEITPFMNRYIEKVEHG